MATNNKSIKLTSELGTAGLEHWSGRINEEWLRDLRDLKKWKTLREMRDNDPIIGAILFAADMLIRQVKWRVEAYGDEEVDIEAQEFLESVMNDMSHSWGSMVSEILSFLPYGFSYHEIVYKRRLGSDSKDPSRRSKYNDGKIGWRKIPIRAQNTLDHWLIDTDGGVQGMVQQDPVTGSMYEIPIEKSLLFRTSTYKNNPEGRSVMRNAFRPWFFKKRIEEIEGIGVERDLAGLPVIYAPNKIMFTGANSEDASVFNDLKKIVRNIRRDEQEGIIMPGDRDTSGNRLYELTLLTTGGTRQFNTNEVIGRYEQRIAMTMLADFILLGHEKVGSFALSSNKTDLFATALGAWLDEIVDIFNQHAVPRLFRLNGFKLEGLPKFVHDDIETPDLKDLGEYISKLAGAGAELFPDDDLENALRGFATLPEKKVEDEDDYPPAPSTQEPEATDQTDAPTTETAAKPTEVAAPVSDLAVDPSMALNGAQITAIITVVQAVQAGELSKTAGISILGKLNINPEEATIMLTSMADTTVPSEDKP